MSFVRTFGFNVTECSWANGEGDLELFDKRKNQMLCRFDEIETPVEECAKKTAESVLDGLPERHQKLYKEVFDLIYDCSVNQVAARSLIDRMLGRLSRM